MGGRSQAAVPVVVIGAGPYGLSVSSHLAGAGIDHVVFGEVMRSWTHHMPRGMLLKSEPGATSLSDPKGRSSLERYSHHIGASYTSEGVPLSLETFSEYGTWFAKTQDLPVEERMVERVNATGGGFTVETADKTIEARSVVVAVGIVAFDFVPPELAGLPAELVSHSAVITEPSEFAGRDVAIVGGGASALELGALIAEAGGRPVVVARRPSILWAGPPDLEPSWYQRIRRPRAALCAGWPCWIYSNAPRLFHRFPLERRQATVHGTFGPGGGWWLRDRVEGAVDVRTNCRVEEVAVDGGRARLRVSGGDVITVDHVIAATGYRPDITRVDLLDPDLRTRVAQTNGYPVLSQHFESSVTGLFVVGALSAYAFGPAMRFVWGADFAARRVAARIRRTAPRSVP